MLERIIATITVGFIAWLDKRLSTERVALDADIDRSLLRRAGVRLRVWLRAK